MRPYHAGYTWGLQTKYKRLKFLDFLSSVRCMPDGMRRGATYFGRGAAMNLDDQDPSPADIPRVLPRMLPC